MQNSRIRLLLFTILTVTLAISLQAADPPGYTVTMLPLPGASAAGISMDYLGYDPVTNAVWVPAGNTGSGDVMFTVPDGGRSVLRKPASSIARRCSAKRMLSGVSTSGMNRVLGLRSHQPHAELVE